MIGINFALLTSYCAFRHRFNLLAAGFIDLLMFVSTAVRYGFWEATSCSFIAVVRLDYFFAPYKTSSFEQNAKQPDKAAIAKDKVKEPLALMDTDKNSKISQQAWMKFMEAEFGSLKSTASYSVNSRSNTILDTVLKQPSGRIVGNS
jgi:hypothetical protein